MSDPIHIQTLHEFYASAMRTGLFSGFLTISGFLFSAHTFLVMQLKKEIYDQEWYRERLAQIRKTDSTRPLYGTLRNLSRVLMTAIVLSFTTSILQFTLGLIPSFWTACVCVFIAILSATFLGASLYVTTVCLRDWFDNIERFPPKV